METSQDQLVGGWQLWDHNAFLLHDNQDRTYPLGIPHGFIIFTNDGYMAFHACTARRSDGIPNGNSNNIGLPDCDSYTTYTGTYRLRHEESTNHLILEALVRYSNIPEMVGSKQKRLVTFVEGENASDTPCLVLQTVQTMKIDGQERIVQVRWRRSVH